MVFFFYLVRTRRRKSNLKKRARELKKFFWFFLLYLCNNRVRTRILELRNIWELNTRDILLCQYFYYYDFFFLLSIYHSLHVYSSFHTISELWCIWMLFIMYYYFVYFYNYLFSLISWNHVYFSFPYHFSFRCYLIYKSKYTYNVCNIKYQRNNGIMRGGNGCRVLEKGQ